MKMPKTERLIGILLYVGGCLVSFICPAQDEDTTADGPYIWYGVYQDTAGWFSIFY
jgi:hypothetical protein